MTMPFDRTNAAEEHGRRRFLRQTLAGTLFLSLGKVPLIASQQSTHPAKVGTFFDAQEFEVFRAVADRIVGPRPEAAPSADEIASRADAFLATDHPEIQDQFHLLLTLFNSAWVAFLFDLRASTFLSMSDDEKDAYLRDWMESPLAFRRTAFQGLKRLSMSVYYTHPGSWQGVGFDGSYGR